MGISKRRARAGEGGWPPIPVPRKIQKVVFVELGRRDWGLGRLTEGGGIILTPAILLGGILSVMRWHLPRSTHTPNLKFLASPVLDLRKGV